MEIIFALLAIAFVVAVSWFTRGSKTQPPSPPVPPDPPPAKPYRLDVTKTTAKGVAECVYYRPAIADLSFYYQDGASFKPTPRLLCDLWMADVLTAFALELRAIGIGEIHHFGIYNYRVVAGTNTLSKHAQALALDFSGCALTDGTRISVKDHWGQGDKGVLLAEIRSRANAFFHGILDPRSNAAHKDHFHLELNPSKRPKTYQFSGPYSEVPEAKAATIADLVAGSLNEEPECGRGRVCEHV